MERIINNWIKSIQRKRARERQNNFFREIVKPIKL